ncbi:hypothetical protein NRB20_20190 [Nocardia sp. RB20]|uniref:Uncharacterized protein n=1 Tax=Nocardia macrotermitis TaxID=2585198 RepID=A0A7K0CZP3_9NOCA|nr:hypothetical protein [Nocardia macrotermitis]
MPGGEVPRLSDSYHSGPTEIRELMREELPQAYLELVHANS